MKKLIRGSVLLAGALLLFQAARKPGGAQPVASPLYIRFRRWLVSIRDKLDIAANVATVGAAVLISAALIKVYFAPSSQADLKTRPITASQSAQLPAELAVGTSLAGRVPGVDWRKNGKTLVLAISTQCHFCKDSAPFYRKLHEQVGKGLKTVAVLPQPVAESEQYLKSEGVHVDQVKQVSMGDIGVQGTPTMLLVDGTGAIARVWFGKIQPEQEEQVLADLRKG